MDAVEDAFIRGDWENVLERSKDALARVMVEERTSRVLTQDEGGLVSMYLHAVLELRRKDELHTATSIINSLPPLPFHIALQWVKFLIAMDQQSVALDALNEVLQSCAADQTNEERKQQYAIATEVLVLHILMRSDRASSAATYVANDQVLDGATKQRLLQVIQAQDRIVTESREHSSPAQPSSRPANATQPTANAVCRPVESGVASEDAASDLFAIGGTALAVAAVAVTAFSYRDRLREGIAQIGPAISSGLADAKHALFD